MKILHYLPSFRLQRGGPVRAVLDLASNLVSRGHGVTLLTCEYGDIPAAWAEEGAGRPRVVLMDQPETFNGPIGRAYRGVIAREVGWSDVVHVHGVWNYSNVQLAGTARAQGKPYIVSLRGMLDDWSMEQKALKKRVFHFLIYKKLLERAAAVHCTAQAELDQSKKWFPRGRGIVVANLLDLGPFRAPPGPGLAREKFAVLGNGKRNVLFLSRLHYKKGAEVLIGAAALLRGSGGVACNFILAGEGDESYVRTLKELAADRGVAQDVHFVGHVSGALKVSLYQAADIFALPTSQENFGFVFPEALASGTPVVTTKGVDIWGELLAGGGAAIVERTQEAFAHEIAAILGDEVRLERMRAASRPFVFATYDEGVLMDQFERMYAEALRGYSAVLGGGARAGGT